MIGSPDPMGGALWGRGQGRKPGVPGALPVSVMEVVKCPKHGRAPSLEISLTGPVGLAWGGRC